MQLADPITQPQFYRDVATKRLLAWVIDTIIILLISLLIVPFTAFVAVFFIFGLMTIVGFVYRVITLATGSATWGMRLMAVEIRGAGGERLDFGQAFFAHTRLHNQLGGSTGAIDLNRADGDIQSGARIDRSLDGIGGNEPQGTVLTHTLHPCLTAHP